MKRALTILVICVAQTLLSVHAQQLDLKWTKGSLPVSRITPGVAGNCLTTDTNGNTAWGSCASASGTVTSFASGNLAPIFTAAVSNATTTPSLAFTLTNAAAHTFLGNNTGVSAAPAYVAITAADLPGSITSSTSGNAATATALAADPGDCAANNFAISIDAGGNLTCAQVAYGQVSGTPALPLNTTSTAHQFFAGYNSTNGAFSKAQPDYSDLTGTPVLPANTTATAHQFFNSYSSATGAFTKAQPDYSDLTGIPSAFAPTVHNLLSATHGDTAAHTVIRGDIIAGIGASPTWTAVAKGGTNTYPKWNSSGDVVPSTNPASGTGSPAACSNQFVTAFTLNADAAPTSTCSTVAYSQVSGTPTLPANTTATAHQFFTAYNSATGAFTKAQPDYSDLTGTPTLEYQTVQDEGTPLTQRSAINFTGAGVSCADNAVSSRTDCTISGGGGAGSGTVTDTAGALTAGQLIVGNGGDDIKTGDLSGDVSTSGGTTTTINAGAVTRADLASDAVGWQFLGSTTLGVNASTIAVDMSPTRKHLLVRFLIVGYSGTGVARVQFGNTATADTGSNYAFGGLNIASGTSTAPTVSGMGSGSTAQNGVPVSGSTTTAGRFVQVQISNPGVRIKYFTVETSGVGTSAAVTPNLAYLAGTWNNTTDGIGTVQFTACTSTTGTCTTTSFLSGSSMAVWGRDDN